MLTSEHAIINFKGRQVVPDRLTQGKDRHYVNYAARMLEIYRVGQGKTRRELHRQIQAIFANESGCPTRRIAAFCKLLDDVSTYQTDKTGKSSKLRLTVFKLAAEFHPLVEKPDRLFDRGSSEVKAKIAESLDRPWPEIEAALYADVLAYQPLLDFDGYPNPEAFLSRYNVAQLQACLYRATRVTVWAREDFKIILRYVKLSRLLHEITRLKDGSYRFVLTGPASHLKSTRRYGIRFARFLPALLSCRDWRMQADVATPWDVPAQLRISDRDGFTSHLPAPADFDSQIEENFAKKFGDVQDGWHLIREGYVLHDRQRVFTPDFLFRHEDGTEVLMEVVGFWTPEYLSHKREALAHFRPNPIILAIQQQHLKVDADELTDPKIIPYKTAIQVKPILESLEKIRSGCD